MFLIAGPCVIEPMFIEQTASAMKSVLDDFPEISFYFKSSCIKDNRTRSGNYRGPGFEKGIEILQKIQKKYDWNITTDFHNEEQIKLYGPEVDMIQIPAFLAQQTSILEMAAKVGTLINVKKPQMMLPTEVNIISNILKDAGAQIIFITDRGTFSGGKHLYMDPRHYDIMRMFSVVNILADITHPNKFYLGNMPLNLTRILGRSAIVSGADGIFMEVHYSPNVAFCDATTQISTKSFRNLLNDFTALERYMER